jgi:hypothetical protein
MKKLEKLEAEAEAEVEAECMCRTCTEDVVEWPVFGNALVTGSLEGSLPLPP